MLSQKRLESKNNSAGLGASACFARNRSELLVSRKGREDSLRR